MAFVPFTTPDGGTVYLDGQACEAVVPLAADVATSRVITVSGTVNDVLGTALAVATALGIMPGGVTLGIPQTLSGPTTPAGTDGYFTTRGNVPELAAFVIPNDPLTPATRITYYVDTSTVVLGDPVTVGGLLAPPSPPFAFPFRNTYDGFSSDVQNEAWVTTLDADRVIGASELVTGASLVWSPPGFPTVPRAWTMPTLAAMDAAIAGNAAGKALTAPGSGAKSVVVLNLSPVALSILDSADFHSPNGVGFTIPPGEQALLTWGCVAQVEVDSVPIGPGTPGWTMTIGAGAPRAGQIWAGGLVNPGTGAVIPGFGFGGAAASGPYTPGSGFYGFSFNPVPPGWGYLVMTSPDNAGAVAIAGNEGGPGNCSVIGTEIPGPWSDAVPFKWVIVLVPPAGP